VLRSISGRHDPALASKKQNYTRGTTGRMTSIWITGEEVLIHVIRKMGGRETIQILEREQGRNGSQNGEE